MPTYEITMALPLKVLQTRDIHGIGELARRMDMNRATVSRVLSKAQPPGRLFVERFLRTFPGTTLEEMFIVHE